MVRQAKRTMESNNPTFKALKSLCGPKLLEKRKRTARGHTLIACLRLNTANRSLYICGRACRTSSVSREDGRVGDTADRGFRTPSRTPPMHLHSWAPSLQIWKTRDTCIFDPTLQFKKQFRAHCNKMDDNTGTTSTH